jgi:hypothetical protein
MPSGGLNEKEGENGRMGEGVREIHANLHPATCNMHPSNYL